MSDLTVRLLNFHCRHIRIVGSKVIFCPIKLVGQTIDISPRCAENGNRNWYFGRLCARASIGCHDFDCVFAARHSVIR